MTIGSWAEGVSEERSYRGTDANFCGYLRWLWFLEMSKVWRLFLVTEGIALGPKLMYFRPLMFREQPETHDA